MRIQEKEEKEAFSPEQVQFNSVHAVSDIIKNGCFISFSLYYECHNVVRHLRSFTGMYLNSVLINNVYLIHNYSLRISSPGVFFLTADVL